MSFIIKENAEQIAKLNDQFRQTFRGGKVNYSDSVKALPTMERIKLFDAIKGFSNFNAENNPYQERHFGAIVQNGERYLFWIDCFTLDLKRYSDNPADPAITQRVMTIIAESERRR